ncbi:Rieske 2Fe-2S domain-containing protein [Mycobacterium sp. CVI_P3]|uniref:Rieske 2Fe-2S domain-containing protein n=1 Tax=Mycobacterium pinniadriaticum TaxID=2994102 RepID=A0ABT3SGZ0_9MYCO|nr:Rieske 2Fe-2S domain-containing protein [Mycobacterium pinniadriaticum]MCX2932364.1 Rieske 2Fe-2S domain-containing protein [Mycobacterium pinniadriaticum]MCX2938779.1 Rieske 2Fe-2S domain-containing protein [Mycobacterium pinniadriaticum]
MTANYPRNCWYVAATVDEVTSTPLGRRLVAEDVVLWRSQSGRVTAFENRCAHRAFPLTPSLVDGEQLVCGYHGCTYDQDGLCTHIPSQDRVPTGMRVRVFPVLEDPPFVWIWSGSPRAAAISRPPAVPWVREAGWESFRTAWDVAANYLMVHEHYLDFSYAPILHAADIPASIRSMPAFSEVEVTETTVTYTRVLPPARPTDWEAEAGGLPRDVDYRRTEEGTFASPALHLQRWDVETPAGETLTTTRVHAITPIDDTSTRVVMVSSRNYALGRPASTERLKAFLAGVATRDTAVLEMAARHSGYDRWRDGVEFQADLASLRLRRIVDDLLGQEARSPHIASAR